MDKYPQDEVAKLLSVELRTLRQWRLDANKGTALYLPAHRDKATSTSYYLLEDLVAFCIRNPRYGNQFLRPFAEESVRQLPAAMSASIVAKLRNEPMSQKEVIPIFGAIANELA